MGIPKTDISVELRGTQDLRGFMGVDENVPAGFLKIEGDVIIDSPASAEQLEKLQTVVDKHCPVLDGLIRPVPVTLKVKSGDD